ncbi:RagB/SusD family nutrient uptake outer membrane protein [Dysgonomonas sp. Marseille-P4677]|uniref:RagB/SusD family nutrient uptake outer membrane protein n=1 Tax=Dysgonomonas sp. Marseille-P4677 TaxID=2364790 RepID=UPI001913938C|nr:RagB/SusD family nutrient uptake outer membrane protein [Dysgonomonas sp. Marseille-P4677]MBK5722798.1 RagB/SusD family nutrient uptake outer membrane protein [Dysgonomonas sp. Marseille-P4677]
MNKKYISVFTGILMLFGLSSCSDYLNQVPTDITSLEKVYETRSGVQDNLATVYSSMPAEFEDRWTASGGANGTSGAWNAGCDDAEFVWDFNGAQTINNGSLTSETGFVYSYWHKWYKGIRAATLFMENIHICKVLEPGDLEQWTAEARAARAIYYYYLLRLYGPVPIIETPISEQAPISELNTSRNSVPEVVAYILSELDAAINGGLISNIKQSSSETITSGDKGLGHIDKVIARAFKIQVRMLAASDLFNGSNSYYASLTNPDGKKLFPSYSDSEKKQLWAEAAEEAKTFIQDYVGRGYELTRKYTNGNLDPYLSYREAVRGATSELTDFGGTTSAAEMIWFNKQGNASTMHYNRTPKHFGFADGVRCSGGMAATQESVDAYFMSNGLKPITGYQSDGKTPIINTASGYTESGFSTADYKDPVTGRVLAPKGVWNAWVNREPRFYADITFDGQKWLYEGSGVVYTGLQNTGNSGRGTGNTNDYSKSGYVVRKSAPLTVWGNNDRVSIMLRLAQIYLDYAEALNESNPGNADILKYVNLIRERAGIPQYGSGAGKIVISNDQATVRQAIRNERRVELAFESCRYFDVRRWCTAENASSLDYQGKAIYGMNIDKDGEDFFVRTKVEDRAFSKKNYFFPLPLKDLVINKNLVQNPGW